MSESRVIITAQAEQAIREFRRLQQQGSGSLRELSNAGGLIDNTLRRTTNSAAQTTAALRQVPAQFTDIITSLQGGQAPLTVLLQQGGQLKDMFGGVSEAVQGLGGYVIGLIDPFAVVAAAVLGLAVAHRAGAMEAEGYRRTLILSGNAIGATSGQLADAARNIGLVSGSQRVASEAVTALAGSTRVSIASLQKYGGVAVEVQKVVGRSISETVEDFSELGKAPLTALAKINEKYHFITSATFAQVKALQDQGRATDAATVAQNAYAEAVTGQKQKILDSLTDWERGWIRIKNAASGAVDAAIDLALGRQATNTQKISAALAEREIIEKRIQVAVSKGDKVKEAQFRQDLSNNAAAINAVRQKDDAAKASAEAEAKATKATELRNKWLGESDTLMTRVALRDRELAAARTEGAANGLNEGEIQNRLAVIRKKYNDIFVDGVDAQIAALNRRSAVEDVINKRAIDAVAFQRSAGMLNDQQALEKTTALELAAFDNRKKALQEELALIRQKQNSRKDQADKQGEVDALEEERTARKIKGANDLFLAEQKLFRQSADNYAEQIEKSMGDTATLRKQLYDQQDYNAQIGLTQIQLANLVATRMNDAAAVLEQNAAIADSIDLSGRQSEQYREQARLLRETAAAKVIGATSEQQFDEWKKSVDQYSDVFRTGFADMLNSGTDGWRSFTKSLVTTFKTTVADQIYKMFAQPFVVRMVASLLGVSGSATATMAQAASGTGAAGGAGGYVSIAQSAKAAYDAITGGFATLSTTVADTLQAGLYSTGMSSSILTNGPLATAAGTAAGYAGGVAAGKVIGSAISGQYGIGDHGSAIVNIGTVAGAVVGGPIGAAIGGAIGGLLNRAFGRGPEQVTGRSLSGTLGGGTFSGTANENIHQDGGWFRSDYNGVRQTALDGTASKALSDAYEQIKVASSDFASALGINASSIASRTQALNVTITTDEEANKKAIADFFVGVGDTIAKELVPSITQFIKEGETASSTFQRIAGDYAFLDTALASIGARFGAVGVESVAARERLIELAGGVDTLGRGTAFFAANFLTEAERMAPIAAATKKTLAELGYATLNSRDDFKKAVLGLVDSGALATEAGAKTYAGLMSVEEAFAQLYPALESTADAGRTAADILSERKSLQQQLDQLELTDAQQRAKARLDVAPDNLDLFDQITRKQEIKAATDAFKGLFDSLKSSGEGVTAFMNSLKTGNLSTLTPKQRYLELQRQYEETLAKAKASPADSAAQTAAQNAASSFLTASQVINASSAAYVSDRAKVLGDMTSLSAIIGAQMSDAQKQLALAGDQVTGLATLNTTALGIQEAIVSLGSGSAIVAPNFDASAYAGAADGRDVLVDEIRRLNAQIKDLVALTQGRRSDAARQADGQADITEKTAETIAAGLADAVSKVNWRDGNPTGRPPRY